jgi:hypothetical protein
MMSEYQSASSQFAASVAELHKKMGTSPKSEYDRLLRASEDARLNSERARLTLEQHVDAHHC